MAAKKKVKRQSASDKRAEVMRERWKLSDERRDLERAMTGMIGKLTKPLGEAILGKGTSCDLDGDQYSWEKRGGHPNHKLNEITSRAVKKKFVYVAEKRTTGGCPDGSSISSGNHYEDKWGNIVKLNTHYGGVAYENSFSATLKVSARWLEAQKKKLTPNKRIAFQLVQKDIDELTAKIKAIEAAHPELFPSPK